MRKLLLAFTLLFSLSLPVVAQECINATTAIIMLSMELPDAKIDTLDSDKTQKFLPLLGAKLGIPLGEGDLMLLISDAQIPPEAYYGMLLDMESNCLTGRGLLPKDIVDDLLRSMENGT